ncbi:MAG: sigma-54 dependent transcriptional regulator [Myxococcales bacterium]|nr:sigma-54 dependent transcriptional regulator [Myxococcales bacterium]
MPKVLLLDDVVGWRKAWRRKIEARGYEVLEASTPLEAVELLETHDIHVAVVDICLPTEALGLEVLRKAREVARFTECIAVTGAGDVQLANQCLAAGAGDYLEKAPEGEQRFTQVVERAMEISVLRRANDVRRDEPAQELFGSCAEMVTVREHLRRFAESDVPVLVHGESGTGKELAARALHESAGKTGRFVPVNCGSPSDLREARFFGYKKGSFTGADRDHEGYLSQARDGTLFLDEIGDMPMELQRMLLRVLETGDYQPLGANAPIALRARVVAATHKDLEQLVQENKFRADLLFRLRGGVVRLPPLRDRGADLRLLVFKFIQDFNVIEKRSVNQVDPAAMEFIERCEWPGNVRELRYAIWRGVLFAPGSELRLADLPDELTSKPEASPAPTPPPVVPVSPPAFDLPYKDAKEAYVAEFTRQYLEHHLERNERVIKRAAQSAGMLPPNFSRLLKRYGAGPHRPEGRAEGDGG